MSPSQTRLLSLTGLAIAFLLAAPPAKAALDFHTYRIVENVKQVRRNGELEDSVYRTYELTRLGSTSLEASSLTLTSHGSYLSVVEEATLTGNIESRPREITRDFLYQGSVPVPPLAAVHAVSVRHGDTLFNAKLRKMTYSLDDYFLDTTALKATLDARVAFLQQLGDGVFEATFSKVSLGEPVRVRVAYDLPFPGAPGAEIIVPVLFHPSGNPPRQAQITFFESTVGLPALQWLSESGRVTLSDSGTHTVSYASAFRFRRDEAAGTTASLQATTFEAGRLKGNYLLFKGGLDDSLMNRLSRPLEVTFLWRWNPPYRFVEFQNGLKTLSPLGLLVAQEARALKQIVEEMAPRGHRFGLYRSAPGYTDAFHPPAVLGSDGYKALLAYLDAFTEQRLYADYKDYEDKSLPWATKPWNDSGDIVKSRQDFLATLARIRDRFGNDPDALKHIAMIGFGGAPSTLIDLKDPKAIEAVLDSVTLSNVLAPWLGVDFGSVLATKANQDLRPLQLESPLAVGLPPLLFPVFQPTSVEYRAFTATRSHAVVMPFSRAAQRQAVIKAATPFHDSLQLQGIDALGRKTRILPLLPRMLRTPADSGLARLWAADPDRIAEDSEVEMGMRYGILTKGSYWGASVEDARTVQPEGTPVLPKVVRAGSAGSFRLEAGLLRITPPADLALASSNSIAPVLEIYDLRGKLVLRISLAAYRRGAGFDVPLAALERLGKGRWYLVLRGKGRAFSHTLAFGGAR